MPLRKSHTTLRRLVVVAGVGAAAIAAPSGASAATGALSVNNTCAAQSATSIFAKLGDATLYWQAPDGGFEAGGQGWKLTGGAKVVTGNETLGILPGTKSLALAGAGLSTATSPPMCIDPSHPTFRFLVKNAATTAVINTYVNFTASSGATLTVPAAVNAFNFGKWTLAKSQPLATTIPSIFMGTGTTATITMKAQAVGASSVINVDDVMIDPYRRG